MRILHHQLELAGPGWIRIAGAVEGGQGLPWERLRTLPEYAICLITAGTGRYRDERSGERTLAAGDAIMVFPGMAHAFSADGSWDELFLCFNGPVFAALKTSDGPLDRNRPVLRVAHPRVWSERLAAVVAPRPQWPAERPLARAGELVALLAEMAAEDRTGAASDGGTWLIEAQTLLAGRSGARTATVAAALGMAVSTFRRRFTAATGLAPDIWRAARLAERVRDLLRVPDLPLQAIADATGFANAFHLSRRFRQATGLSPRQWRERESAKAVRRARKRP